MAGVNFQFWRAGQIPLKGAGCILLDSLEKGHLSKLGQWTIPATQSDTVHHTEG